MEEKVKWKKFSSNLDPMTVRSWQKRKFKKQKKKKLFPSLSDGEWPCWLAVSIQTPPTPQIIKCRRFFNICLKSSLKPPLPTDLASVCVFSGISSWSWWLLFCSLRKRFRERRISRMKGCSAVGKPARSSSKSVKSDKTNGDTISSAGNDGNDDSDPHLHLVAFSLLPPARREAAANSTLLPT